MVPKSSATAGLYRTSAATAASACGVVPTAPASLGPLEAF